MPPDTIQAKGAVQWALQVNETGITVLNDGSSYSVGLAKTFYQAAKPYRGLAGKSITIAPPALDNLLGQVGNSAIFYAPSTVANAVAVAKGLQGSTSTVFATDTALDSQFGDEVAPFSGDWRIVSNSADYSDLPAYSAFAQQFQGAYGVKPSQFAANAYDATNLILDNVAKTGNDRAAITSGVLGTQDYRGATGLISFDPPTGERTSWRATGYRLVNDEFQPVSTLSGTTAP